MIRIGPLGDLINWSGDSGGIVTLPIPWESLSESESDRNRSSNEYGWSLRVRCRVEYKVRNENAAEVGLSWMRWMNAGVE